MFIVSVLFIRIHGWCSRCVSQPEQVYVVIKNIPSFSYIVIVANVSDIDIALHVSAFSIALLISIEDQ